MKEKEKITEKIYSELNRAKGQILLLERKLEAATKEEEKTCKDMQETTSLFKYSPQALVYVDTKNIIIDINLRFTELFGYKPEELLGKNINQGITFSPNKIEEVKILFKKSLIKNYYNYETIRKRKDGSCFPVQISCSKVFLEGRFNGRILSYIDITEKKYYEKIQQVLYSIAKTANSSISLAQLYQKIHLQLGTLMDTTNFYIALVDKEKDLLYFPYHVDQKDHDFSCQKFSQSAQVIKTGKPFMVKNKEYQKMMASGEISPRVITSPNNVWLGLPLKIKDDVIGAMVVQSYNNSNLYNPKTAKLMEFVSKQVAIAIERKRKEEELEKLAHYDFLTGACNRRYGFELLKRQIKIVQRNKSSFLLAYIDLDHLKEINDQFGHREGDRAIKKLVRLFRSTLREVDIIIRMGGDEFLLVFPESSIKDMFLIKKRLYHQLARKNKASKKLYDISFSMGFSCYNPKNPLSIVELIKVADQRMYKNKKEKNIKKLY